MKRFSFVLAFFVSLLFLPCLKSSAAPTSRPQFIGRESSEEDDEEVPSRGANYLQLSPDEKYLISQRDDKTVLWDLARGHHRVLPGDNAVFSSNSRLIASYDDVLDTIYLSDITTLKWHKHVSTDDDAWPLTFAFGDKTLHYNVERAHGEAQEVSLDVKSGKVLGRKTIASSPWRESNPEDSPRVRVSFVPSGSKRAKFSFETSNEYDDWQLAPDKAHLWVSREEENRFDVRDAKTGRKLWSYFSKNADSGQFMCYPAWVWGGKALATIENDTLIVRGAQTGKVLLSHKNPLTNPLISWAFTHDRNTVYLMDAKGKIYRQRLS